MTCPFSFYTGTNLCSPVDSEFAVDGTSLPEVDFDVGESYAGRLSIYGANSTSRFANRTSENELFFWFFPSENELASNEIVIWLNGGPGCSSMDGLFQENGPFLWQSGTYSPQPNPFAWTNLTNMVWIDQPIGTGLSNWAPGAPELVTSEAIVAEQFAGFWQNFIDTFDMQGYDVYITGESYAGMYVPYIASHFLDLNDTSYYNVKGIQINDPSIGSGSVLEEAPAAQFLRDNSVLFNLNDTTTASIYQKAEDCGYNEFLDLALTFPPSGKFPSPTSFAKSGVNVNEDCDVWDDSEYLPTSFGLHFLSNPLSPPPPPMPLNVHNHETFTDPPNLVALAAIYVNPCFNFYHVTDFCPFLWDELGFPSLGWGPNNYFNRTDVQQALNVNPHIDYAVCGESDIYPVASQPSSYVVLPSVIERTNNVIVGNGNLDFLIQTNGTLAVLNNMTWNGQQGFSSNPFADTFYVPYGPTIGPALEETFYQSDIPAVSVGYVGGGGSYGTTHTERGLTFTTVALAGHEIPQ